MNIEEILAEGRKLEEERYKARSLATEREGLLMSHINKFIKDINEKIEQLYLTLRVIPWDGTEYDEDGCFFVLFREDGDDLIEIAREEYDEAPLWYMLTDLADFYTNTISKVYEATAMQRGLTQLK